MLATKRGNGKGQVVDLTVKILREIRDELRALRVGQDRTNERLDHTNERIDHTNERIDRSIAMQITQHTDTNARLEQLDRSAVQGFTAVAKHIDALGARIDNLRDVAGDRTREHEERLTSAERRLDRLEAKEH